MRISDYLDSRLITFLDVNTRDEALIDLIDLLDAEGHLHDALSFRKAIFDRENLITTGIGLGVAIPHAKLKNLPDFFVCIGIQKKKGIEWNALDNAPVRLVFMIGGPDDQSSVYLQILSCLTSLIRDVDFRKKLLNASTSEEALALFSEV